MILYHDTYRNTFWTVLFEMSKDVLHPAPLNFDRLRIYATVCEKCLLAVHLENRLPYMHGSFGLRRP